MGKREGEPCARCGVWITWATKNGVPVQFHEGNVKCVPSIYKTDGRPIECQTCHRIIYHVEHQGKHFFANKTGKPWPKHQCFTARASASAKRKNEKQSNDEQVPRRCEFSYCNALVLPKDYRQHLKKEHMVTW